jgi:uridine kinase
LAAITGIDASGKGYVARRLTEQLEAGGLRTACINIDGWLNLPHVRFSKTDPGATFYRRAIRFEEMFRELVLPLRERRSIDIETDFTEETEDAYRRHRYRFQDVDVIVLEGVFLLQREFQSLYDVSIWIDCTYETALERAVARAQEGLAPEETIRAYREIYFPAQEIHRARDAPREAAGFVVVNDPRIGR